MPLPAMHPTASVTVYAAPDDLAAGAVRPGGLRVPSDSTVGTYTMEVEDITSSVAGAPGGELVRLALRLWPRDITPAYKQGQTVRLTHRGRAERLLVERVLGPWNDGDPDDHVELVCVDRSADRARR